MRNYSKEYSTYHASPIQKKKRASRNAARNSLKKRGLVRKGDGKDVDHINMNPLNNSTQNLRITSSSFNKKRQPPTKRKRK
jgi:hypothetical protein|tara:strand:+ start:2763 stop:3005 length:243 start_codon:yes stop_codon:yes gene_type:complete